MERHLRDLCLIDKEAFDENAWIQRNFGCALPGKFYLSRIALYRGKAIGYLIASKYSNRIAHIHRLVVPSRFKRKGIGARLLKSFEDTCLATGMAEITLESLSDRYDANSFYEHMGFVRMSGEKLARYLERKGKTEISQQYSGVDSTGNILVYSKPLKSRR